MTILIPDNATLRRYLPNVISEVKGEASLFDKISPWLDTSEYWLASQFLSDGFLDKFADFPGENVEIKDYSRAIVATNALMQAIPSLDLVLTPNGFGVVSNQNVAPASKDRVAALLASLETLRDDAINSLLILVDKYSSDDQWNSLFFKATMFADLVSLSSVITEHRWESYLRMRPKIMEVEAMLAARFISTELINKLRSYQHFNTISFPWQHLVEPVRSVIINWVQEGRPNVERILDIVNVIRNNPDDFPEWHRSEVASLFSPPIFTNQKQSRGYFF